MEAQGPRFFTGLIQLANRIDLYNFGRWLILALVIGVVAGLGAALLTWGVDGVAEVRQGPVVGTIRNDRGFCCLFSPVPGYWSAGLSRPSPRKPRVTVPMR